MGNRKKLLVLLLAAALIVTAVAVINLLLPFKGDNPSDPVPKSDSPSDASSVVASKPIDSAPPVSSDDPLLLKPVLFEEDEKTYIEVEGTKILLVNKRYSLPADYGSENEEARAALDGMIAAASEDGVGIFIVSGFRSYDTQESIYNNYVAQWGQEYTDTVSARPGHSEHQAGLSWDLNSLERAFADTAEYAWLKQHCAEHGFILRYLDGKTWATGYVFEPWHYRYIGDAALAKKIMDSGLSLEEYAGIVTGDAESGYIG